MVVSVLCMAHYSKLCTGHINYLRSNYITRTILIRGLSVFHTVSIDAGTKIKIAQMGE